MHPCDAEDAFTAWLALESGAGAAIDTTFAAAATVPTRLVIAGSEGVVDVTNDRRIVLRRLDGTREESEVAARRGDPHAGAMRRWVDVVCEAVAAGEQITPSFADGLACALVLDAFRSGWPGHDPS